MEKVKSHTEEKYSSYFASRGVSPEMYANASLPIWLEELLADKDKNLPILDIGCGFGQNIVALQKAGFTNVRGIDVSEEAVAYCRYKNLPVTLMDVNEYQGEKYEFILMSHVLEHLPKDNIIKIIMSIRDNVMCNGGAMLTGA